MKTKSKLNFEKTAYPPLIDRCTTEYVFFFFFYKNRSRRMASMLKRFFTLFQIVFQIKDRGIHNELKKCFLFTKVALK